MTKKTPPPTGAESFYSDTACAFEDGVVRIALVSGDSCASGALTVRGAAKLHHQLGLALEAARTGAVLPLAANKG